MKQETLLIANKVAKAITEIYNKIEKFKSQNKPDPDNETSDVSNIIRIDFIVKDNRSNFTIDINNPLNIKELKLHDIQELTDIEFNLSEKLKLHLEIMKDEFKLAEQELNLYFKKL